MCVCARAITLTTRMGVYCRESCDNTSSDNSHGAHVNIRVQKVSNAWFFFFIFYYIKNTISN